MTNKEEKELTDSIIILTKLIRQLRSERYLQMVENRKKFIFYNFLSGVFKGIGFAIGTTIVLALVFWLLSYLINVPFLGNWIANIIDYIQEVR